MENANNTIIICKSRNITGRTVAIALLISILVFLLFNSIAFEITNSITNATLDEFKRPTIVGLMLHTIILFIILLLIIRNDE